MRFTAAAAAAAVMAGTAFAHNNEAATTTTTTNWNTPANSTNGPMSTSTVYSTKVHTVIACASTVKDCPAHSTRVTTETVAVSTTICPAPTAPVWGNSTTASSTTGQCGGMPCPPASTPGQCGGMPCPPPASSSGECGGMPCPPVTSNSAAPTQLPPSTSTQAPVCNHSVTAVTKRYTTVLTSVEYITNDVPCPTSSGSTGTGVVPPAPTVPANSTTPVPPPNAGAASLGGSVILAAVAGVAVLIIA